MQPTGAAAMHDSPLPPVRKSAVLSPEGTGFKHILYLYVSHIYIWNQDAGDESLFVDQAQPFQQARNRN